MPVKSPPRERPLLLMFLAEYENGGVLSSRLVICAVRAVTFAGSVLKSSASALSKINRSSPPAEMR